MKATGVKRGALIVLEGCDRVGKTTQCVKLVEKLGDLGINAQLLQFPDRSTPVGKIINNYLVKQEDLSDQAVHLLFSANRWENKQKMKKLIQEGVTLIIDRYSFSGVAYSAAKPGMDFEWCYKPEVGLLKPDLVFLLHVPANVSHTRDGFGEERYERGTFQQAVFENYLRMKNEGWFMVDGNRTLEDIHRDLLTRTQEVIRKVQFTEIQELT